MLIPLITNQIIFVPETREANDGAQHGQVEQRPRVVGQRLVPIGKLPKRRWTQHQLLRFVKRPEHFPVEAFQDEDGGGI